MGRHCEAVAQTMGRHCETVAQITGRHCEAVAEVFIATIDKTILDFHHVSFRCNDSEIEFIILGPYTASADCKEHYKHTILYVYSIQHFDNLNV